MGGRSWLWIIAAICVLMVAALILVAFRSTTITVEPRVQTVVFDRTTVFTAAPAALMASGTLAYRLETMEFTDSESVASSGTVKAEEKASGTLVVYNDYSTSPLRLIKNTRFESTDGHIFRAPVDILVPAKKGTTPGQVSITVVADQAGAAYNAQPGKFTLPGFKSSPEYTKVYAQSSAAFTGGFIGDKPSIADSDLAAAQATLRTRLEKKAREEALKFSSEGAFIFPDLIQISYHSSPHTAESGGARINEIARVDIPIFDSGELASAIARSVSADADDAVVSLLPGEDLAAFAQAVFRPGIDPLQFTLSGGGRIAWEVDEQALAQALAGRDQDAFKSIVAGFSSIQTARARIEPFWSSVFPADAADIKVRTEEPSE